MIIYVPRKLCHLETILGTIPDILSSRGFISEGKFKITFLI